MQKVYIPQLIVIDFDRTLGDVEASMKRFYFAAESVGVNTKEIEKARQSVEQDGGSFDPLTFLTATLPHEKMAQFYKLFRSANGHDILFEDAVNFLKKLDGMSISYFVLTYGVNKDWQGLKLKASGYPGGYKIIDHINKGEELLSWKNKDNEYEITDEKNEITYYAKSVCLIDDKLNAFDQLPADCYGFLIQRSKANRKEPDLSKNVTAINNFDELCIINDQIELAKNH